MKKTLPALVIFSFFIGCQKDDDQTYPVQPFIEFQKVTFIEGHSNNDPDTLMINFTYQDGDADLGLNLEPMDIGSPYHHHYVFIADDKGDLTKTPVWAAWTRDGSSGIAHYSKINFTPRAGDKIITSETREKEGYGFLPEDQCRYAPGALLLTENQLSLFEDPNIVRTVPSGNEELYVVFDAFYHEVNPAHFTIEVDFLLRQPDGSFTEFDFANEFCWWNFDGRFPRMPFERFGPFKAKQHSRWNGELQYSMPFIGYKQLFGDRKIKLRVLIRDRSLNESNIIETPEFTLE